MRSPSNYRTKWSQDTTLPRLSNRHWGLLALPAVILVLMAILQIVSFSDFRDFLDEIGVGGPTATGIILIIIELWGAASLLRVGLSRAFRTVGLGLAILAVGFWFIENIYLATSGAAGQLPNSGYFGGYLTQSPGWLTVFEASAILFWVVYGAELLKPRSAGATRSEV